MGLMMQRFKQVLVETGARGPKNRLLDGQMVLNYLLLGRWLRDHDYRFPTLVADRLACWDHVGQDMRDRPVLFLEFGVLHGVATRYWSKLLRHPASQLHGFDSFEGLPETFSDHAVAADRNNLSVDGRIPVIDDARVRFHKGWFSDTLPRFEVPPHDQLFILLDADLYSSTKTVLDALDPWIVPGTFIYFDELGHVNHEPLAFQDYMRESGKRFEGVVAEWSRNCAVFRCIS